MRTITPRPAARVWGWWEKAACRGYWELFDDTNEYAHREARKICADCPVFNACMEETMELLDTPGVMLQGTWAGVLFDVKGRPNRRVAPVVRRDKTSKRRLR